MDFTFILFIIIVILLTIFIPNNGNPSLLDQLLNKLRLKKLKTIAKENKGNKSFILDMVNKKINEDNTYEMDFYDNLKDIQPQITDIDPFTRYIFHGECHECKTPEYESISGCYSCTYYNIWEGEDKSKFYKDK